MDVIFQSYYPQGENSNVDTKGNVHNSSLELLEL